MVLKYFGTDGIRGEYGGPSLNDGIAFRAGLAMARLLKKRHETEAPLMVVGRDTRASGLNLLAALGAGFRSEGGAIESIGVAPTPAIAKVVELGDALAGCAITASHNPSKDNGIKFFQSNGTKPSESFELELDNSVGGVAAPKETDFPAIEDGFTEKTELYVSRVKSAFDPGLLSGKRIALDCANGALSSIATGVFESLGAEVDTVGCSPNGSNINDGVGSECPQSMAEMYKANQYDMGFSFDGDGDRMVAFDNKGAKLSGEAVLGLLAIRLKELGQLKYDTLVTTRQSNLGLDSALSDYGVSIERVNIGDKFVSRLMIAKGFSLGGEESGHVVIGGFSMTGDGLFSALSVARTVVEKGESLADLASFYGAFPQETRAIAVASKKPLDECPNIRATMQDLEKMFGDDGRLLVRYSGTEPKIRLLVEAKTVDLATESIGKLEEAVRKDLS
jgi:phosphoglucosamine mutase